MIKEPWCIQPADDSGTMTISYQGRSFPLSVSPHLVPILKANDMRCLIRLRHIFDEKTGRTERRICTAFTRYQKIRFYQPFPNTLASSHQGSNRPRHRSPRPLFSDGGGYPSQLECFMLEIPDEMLSISASALLLYLPRSNDR